MGSSVSRARSKQMVSSATTLSIEGLTVSINPSNLLAFTIIRGTFAMAVVHLSNEGLRNIVYNMKGSHERFQIHPKDGIVGPKRTSAIAVVVSPSACEEWIAHEKSSNVAITVQEWPTKSKAAQIFQLETTSILWQENLE